ncbi:MAG: ribbon-helix-helix protein, CopG family [Pseudonocardiaceae bacterium]
MTVPDPRARRKVIRADYAEEEAAAAEAEALETEQAVLSVRVPASLAATVEASAAAEHIPTSALVRRILTHAVHGPNAPVLTVAEVEEIARRIVDERAAS